MPFPKETEELMRQKAGMTKQRAERIKQSPEWKAMLKLSEDSKFLGIIETYWKKFQQKEGEVFKKELKIEKYPESWRFSHGVIKLKFLREIEKYLGSDVPCNTYFTISYLKLSESEEAASLFIRHQEFIDGDTVTKFEGTLNEFYDYMAKKLHTHN